MFRTLVFLLLLLPTFVGAVGEVDLLWEADTYTPPFYKGLPIWSKQSRINLFAVENIPNESASTLIYRWTRDGSVIGAASGVGKRSLSFADGVLSLSTEIKVDVFKEEGQEPLGTATLILKPSDPRALVVEDNPLYGLMLNKAIYGEFVIKEDESSFSAIPLFSDISKRTGEAMKYVWSTNSGDSRVGERVTYRAPEEGEGTASVGLRITNAKTVFQPKQNNFLIKFNKQNDF